MAQSRPAGTPPVRSTEDSMERRPATIADALAEFIDELVFGGKSPATIRSYRSILKLPDAPFDELDRAYCRTWLAGEVKRRSAGGAPSALTALKAFTAYLVRAGWLVQNPASGLRVPRVPDAPPKALSALQMQALWRAAEELDDLKEDHPADHHAETDGDQIQPQVNQGVGVMTVLEEQHRPNSITHRLLLSLLSAGLRRAEVAALKWQDLDFEAQTMRVLGKGSKVRVVLIPRQTMELIVSGMESNHAGPETARRYTHEVAPPQLPGSVTRTAHPTTGSVFGGILPDAIWRRFKKIARKAGLPQAHPHQLRHTFATAYLRKGGSPLYLQQLGGWSSGRMIAHYGKAALVDAALEEMRKFDQ